MYDQAIDIMSIVTGSLIIALVLFLIILSIIDYFKTEQLRNDYIKTLDEHDKSVIQTYKATTWRKFKK